jgi:hypothetical protein
MKLFFGGLAPQTPQGRLRRDLETKPSSAKQDNDCCLFFVGIRVLLDQLADLWVKTKLGQFGSEGFRNFGPSTEGSIMTKDAN